MNAWDLWSEITEIMGAEEALNALLSYLGTDQMENIGDWINRTYDLGIDEEEDY